MSPRPAPKSPRSAPKSPKSLGFRLSLGLSAVGSLTACPAPDQGMQPIPPSAYADFPQPAPVVVFPEVHAELMLVNNGVAPQLFRIRVPRGDVQIDCAGVAAHPGARLVPELFGPAQAWLLDPGRAMAARPPQYGGQCAVALVDGPGLAPRLLFYSPLEFTPVYQTTEARAVDPARALVVSGTAEGMQWAEHAALHRLERPDEVGVECATPPPGTGVDWSTPPTGLVALLGASVGADGCHALDLQVGEAPMRWFVCAPGVELPFVVGEDLRVGPVFAGVNQRAVDGVRIEGPGGALTLVRGADLPVAYEVSAVEGCEGHVDLCGSFVQAARLMVGGQWAAPGEVVATEAGRLHVYRVEQSAALNLGCLPFAQVGQPVFEAAWVERTPPEEAPGEEGEEAPPEEGEEAAPEEAAPEAPEEGEAPAPEEGEEPAPEDDAGADPDPEGDSGGGI
jgi:hypothetical protein